MSLTCPTTYIRVYHHDLVTNGKATALFAVFASKNDSDSGVPPLFKDEISFTFDYTSSDSIDVQAENAIKLLNGYSACVNS